MKLKKFTPSNCSGKLSTVRTVSFNKKNGMIFLNQATQMQLGINSGDKITFVQDEENLKDWYLMIDENGFPVKRSSASGSIYTISKEVSRNVIESLDINENAVRIVISNEPILYEEKQLYPLVTRLAVEGKKSISPLAPKRF